MKRITRAVWGYMRLVQEISVMPVSCLWKDGSNCQQDKKKKKNWNYVVDPRAGPSLKTTLKPKTVKTLSGNRVKSNQISKLSKEFKRHNSDAHSTTSSASPAQSPCYSNHSDDGSDTEMASGSNRTPVFSFLDLTYWKRQKICCGIIYKGRFG